MTLAPTTHPDFPLQSGAAAMLNLSPVFGITTGTWMLPDGSLMASLLGAAICLLNPFRRLAARNQLRRSPHPCIQ
jgi:hypothetical protein